MSSPAPTHATAGVIAPPPLIYAIPLAASLLLQWWFPLRWLPERLAMPIGLLLIAPAFIALSANLAFRRARTSPKPWKPTRALVVDGPYRFSRNPMYVGMTLLYLGISAWVNSVWPLIFLPEILLVMHHGVIRREEAYLERIFGEEYLAYRRRVRRWL